MGRGKPFPRSLSRLVNAGVVPKPVWMPIVQSTRPPFVPVSLVKSQKIEYPEDRLRSIYLRRNPSARHFPVNLKAKNISDRHISDRFVSKQMKLMQDEGLSEEDAYKVVSKVMNEEEARIITDHLADFRGTLTNRSVKSEVTRLYLASVKDSRRDQALHKALMEQARTDL